MNHFWMPKQIEIKELLSERLYVPFFGYNLSQSFNTDQETLKFTIHFLLSKP